MQSFMQNKSTLSFGPKLPYLAIFGQKIEKAIGIFEINTLEFVKFHLNQKNVEPKMGYF